MIKPYDEELTEVEKGIQDLKEDFSTKKKETIISLGCILLGSSLFSGYTVEQIQILLRRRDEISILALLPTAFTSVIGIIVTVVAFFGFASLWFMAKRRYRKDYHMDRERNYGVSDIKAYGEADWQNVDEQKKCFYISDTVESVPNGLDILGIGRKQNGKGMEGKLYSLRDDLVSMNKHMAIIGTSGAGKSATLVKTMIYQCIIRKSSIIVTDSKGDLYAETAYIAKKAKYKVKMLNLKPDQLMCSDGCDFLKPLREGDDIKATTLATTIIVNTLNGERMDYWANNELNLLKALLLYVALDDGLRRAGRANLAEVYNIVATNTVDELDSLFGILPQDHPALQAYRIFAQCEPKIKGQIVNGMGIRLQILANKWAKRIVSEDEIDLIDPMKEPCIYYVVISDTNTQAMKFIATLFFAELFEEMCAYYDNEKQNAAAEGKKPKCLPVEFILDEFANTGSIPEFDVKISTVRSRNIGIKIILQNVSQLYDMYDKNISETILNNVSVKLLLKTNDMTTAKYFSDIMGTQTVRITNRKYDEKATDIIKAHDAYGVAEGLGKRQLMMPEEFMTMDNNNLVLVISGFHPIMLKKFLYFDHPMSKDEKTVIPGRHIPKWRKRELEKQKDNENEKQENDTNNENDDIPENNNRRKEANKEPDSETPPKPNKESAGKNGRSDNKNRRPEKKLFEDIATDTSSSNEPDPEEEKKKRMEEAKKKKRQEENEKKRRSVKKLFEDLYEEE